ncbi:hypothetical protein BDP55DRAFT_631477 [Colletotrichum godetiae]|uniref:Uncharacterized protein n=1 Tax=Colletotrichum godetiae TaxID=1209918 RepID=A0AAJ0EYM2_9PEZI|nr:uncharacterized protein BDP55DRAFT_631477 [Colletotrichum godetiae]KAK1676314.1 hypothetical protein BDP55DRAFT_631477 [Colletotrichum godetiae]
MRFSAALSVAILASTACAAPVDTEQHPLKFPSVVSKAPTVAAGTAAPPAATSDPSSSGSSSNTSPASNIIASAWKQIFGDKEGEEDPNLGRACFCANGSICCNTSEGLDCTQGLCGLQEHPLCPDYKPGRIPYHDPPLTDPERYMPGRVGRNVTLLENKIWEIRDTRCEILASSTSTGTLGSRLEYRRPMQRRSSPHDEGRHLGPNRDHPRCQRRLHNTKAYEDKLPSLFVADPITVPVIDSTKLLAGVGNVVPTSAAACACAVSTGFQTTSYVEE